MVRRVLVDMMAYLCVCSCKTRRLIFLLMLLIVCSVEGKKAKYVTCGSVIKLLNMDWQVRLHSHDIKYGSGSGQQSVTGTEVQEDVNSHWMVKAGTGEHCMRGEPIKCGAVLRLQHLSTSRNLHSHKFQSPLSGKQEISAYGEKGDGDSGDHWKLICDGEFWERDDTVQLQHVDTQTWLAVTQHTYGRPINGQREVVGAYSLSDNAGWKALEGVFIHPTDFNPKSHHIHTEL